MVGMALWVWIALSAGNFAQTPTNAVTLLSRAARASVVVAELGKVAHIDLQTSPTVSNEVLVINVQECPLNEVMARIAKVTSGEWHVEGQGFRLVAATRVRKEEEQALLVKRRAFIVANLSSMAKALIARRQALSKTKSVSKADPLSPDLVAAKARLELRLLSDELMSNLLQAIDPNELAAVFQAKRIVFSTAPNRLQRTFGANAAEQISEFLQRYNSLVAKLPPPAPIETTGMDASEIALMQASQKRRDQPIAPISKVLLILQARGGPNSLLCSVLMVDDKNQIVKSLRKPFSSATIGVPDDAKPSQKEDPDQAKKQTDLALTEDTKAHIEFQNLDQVLTELPPNLKQLRAKFFDPKRSDPLSFLPTDAVLGYASTRHKPLIANLPDEFAAGLVPDEASSFRSQTKLEDVVRDIEEKNILTDVSDDQYTVLMPSSPVESRQNRLDRSSVSDMMAIVDRGEIPRMDDFASLALRNSDPDFRSILLNLYAPQIPGTLMTSASIELSWHAFRLYGFLSNDLRNELLKGFPVAISRLSADARWEADQIIYGGGAQMTPIDPTTSKPLPNGTTDIRREPTELCPNGLPNDGTLYLDVTSETTACPLTDSGNLPPCQPSILGAMDFAWAQQSRQSQTSERDSDKPKPPYRKLRLGTTLTYNLNFYLGQNVRGRVTLEDNLFNAKGPIVSESDLPAEMKLRIQKEMAVLKEEAADRGANNKGFIPPR